jgi:hypothetical protein
LVTIDRIAYPTYDSLTALAAAAGATERISLMTNILLAPIYIPVGSTAWLPPCSKRSLAKFRDLGDAWPQ